MIGSELNFRTATTSPVIKISEMTIAGD